MMKRNTYSTDSDRLRTILKKVINGMRSKSIKLFDIPILKSQIYPTIFVAR